MTETGWTLLLGLGSLLLGIVLDLYVRGLRGGGVRV
jgi:hypothetical protein